MRKRLVASGAFSKALAALTVLAGMMIYGCSGETPRSETAKEQFKNTKEIETSLLKGKGKGTKKGIGGPRGIKGKLADIDKEKTEDQ